MCLQAGQRPILAQLLVTWCDFVCLGAVSVYLFYTQPCVKIYVLRVIVYFVARSPICYTRVYNCTRYHILLRASV